MLINVVIKEFREIMEFRGLSVCSLVSPNFSNLPNLPYFNVVSLMQASPAHLSSLLSSLSSLLDMLHIEEHLLRRAQLVRLHVFVLEARE